MKFRKMLPVLCMAMGLTFAIPLAAGATGTNSTAEATQKESAGWHKTSDGKWYYILENGSRATVSKALARYMKGKPIISYIILEMTVIWCSFRAVP